MFRAKFAYETIGAATAITSPSPCCRSHPRSAAMNRTALHNLQGILDDFCQQPICLEG